MWKHIWNKDERVNKIILEMLIKADGFDSGAGSFGVDEWIRYTKEFYEKLAIANNDTIFDVGCGSGAFLFPLNLKNHEVAGVDYSIILIELAKKIMVENNFSTIEAINIDETTKYDFVISHSVFHDFPNLDYAKEVITKMVKKANKKIGIFDINDKDKEDIYHNIRMGSMNKDEYEKKYQGLKHMFYTKDFFNQFAHDNGLKIEIWDQSFEDYENSKLRFNVIMERK